MHYTYETPQGFELLVSEHERNMAALEECPHGVDFTVRITTPGYDPGVQDPYIATSVDGKAREDASLINAGEYSLHELMGDNIGYHVRVLGFAVHPTGRYRAVRNPEGTPL